MGLDPDKVNKMTSKLQNNEPINKQELIDLLNEALHNHYVDKQFIKDQKELFTKLDNTTLDAIKKVDAVVFEEITAVAPTV